MSAESNERQPLLPPAAIASEDGVQVNGGDLEAPANKDDAPVKQKKSWWTYLWYSILTVLGIFFAALFIKGFIEADDVNVSAMNTIRVPRQLMTLSQFDLKKALWSALGGGLSGAAGQSKL